MKFIGMAMVTIIFLKFVSSALLLGKKHLLEIDLKKRFTVGQMAHYQGIVFDCVVALL